MNVSFLTTKHQLVKDIAFVLSPKKPHCWYHTGPGAKTEHFLRDVSHLCGMKASFPE